MLYPCAQCGKMKDRPPAHFKRLKTGWAFCSRSCGAAFMSGKNHHSYSSIIRNCRNCNKEIKVRKGRERTQFYCGHKCRGEYLRGQRHHKWEKKTLRKCGICGMGLLLLKRELKKKTYCSRKCADIAHSRRMTGCKNSNYTHGNGYAPYSFLFVRLRDKVRERDGFHCLVCQKSEEEEGRKLEVHHIDWNKEHNFVENLASLCRVCHRKQGGKLEKKLAKSQILSKLLCEKYNYSPQSVFVS